MVPLVFLSVFYFYPLFSILNRGLGDSIQEVIGNVWATLINPSTLSIVWFTFFQATLSTLCTLLLGLPGAFLLARYQFPGKRLIQILTAIPFMMPVLVVAAAFYTLLGPRGWLNLGLMAWLNLQIPPIEMTNSLTAIVLAHIFYNTSIVLRTVSDFWSRLDPRLEAAARSLGANRWQSFSKITLPLLTPAIASASLLVFIFNFTSFGVILILGGPRFSTLEVEIYTQAVSFINLPQAAGLSVLQLIFTISFTLIYQYISSRSTLPLNVRTAQFTQQKLLTGRSQLLAGSILAILLIVHVVPLAALGIRSMTPIQSLTSSDTDQDKFFTLEHYRALFVNRRQSIFFAPPGVSISLSIGYAALTVVLALAIGLPTAWLLARQSDSIPGKITDALLMLPIGTSSVTLGLGFILALNKPPLDLRSSPWLIPLAHTLVALPFVVRTLTPSLRSIQPRLHQAASILGASPIEVLRQVDLPIINRSLLAAATFAFAISFGEFGATALIARPEYPTVPIAIYRLLSQPGTINYGQALALSTILMLVCGVGILFIELVRLPEQQVL
jgi:thiamine transport system permease protein